MATQLFQIVYDERTRRERDPGFAELDNLANERPDWFEYWPIRTYFLRQGIVDNDHYGFFSPNFTRKTGLSSQQVRQHTTSLEPQDVVLFSPLFEDSAMYQNQILQGAAEHPGLIELFSRLYPREISARPLVQYSLTTIFCNYFVASGAFWRLWLAQAERAFTLAENQYSTVGRQLNATTRYDGKAGPSPMKVFCIERLAGVMLADSEHWRPAAPFAYDVRRASRVLEPFWPDLIRLDEIKRDAVATGDYDRYLPLYKQERKALIARAWPGEALPGPPVLTTETS